MENPQRIINLVLKAVAVGMSVVSIVLGFLPDAADVATQITLLSTGSLPSLWQPYRKKNSRIDQIGKGESL